MSINNKAVAEIEVSGTDKAARDLEKVGAAGKKAGKDLGDAFKDAGKSLAAFGASAVDAVVDIKALDPSALMRTFEDYSRAVTKTAIATGQSLDGLKTKYSQLARANGVLPQSIDAFAKSVGKMTYDIRGAQDAFTGMHNAALAFGETDQEQVNFTAYLKNVQGLAGHTAKAVGKIFAQAEELGTTGGARALRDLFVSMGGEVDRLVSRMGNARAETEAFEAVLTNGATGPQAQRIAGGALGFLGSSPLDIQRTLGKPLFDDEGRYKDPVGTYQGLYDLMRKPVASGGRGMDDEQTLLAFQSSLGMEAGTRMFHSLRSGAIGQARELAALGPKGTAAGAGRAYLNSPIGKIDQSRVGIFEAEMAAVGPLFNLKSTIAGVVGEHPIATALVAYGAKTVASKYLPQLLPWAAKAVPVLSAAGGEALSALFMSGDVPRPEIEQMAQSIYDEEHGGMAPIFGYSDAMKKRRSEWRSAVASEGVDPHTASPPEIMAAFESAMRKALESSTVKTQNVVGPAQAAESAKDPASRN